MAVKDLAQIVYEVCDQSSVNPKSLKISETFFFEHACVCRMHFTTHKMKQGMAVSLFLISKVACGLSFIWHRIINQSQFCDDKLSLSHLENQITETAHACDETSILLQNPIYQIAPLKDNTKVVFLLCRVVANQSSSCVQYWFVLK